MSHEFEIFVSSKMLELADERAMLNDLIPSLSRPNVTLKGWVYEHSAHAAEHTIREEYLEALKNSELYIGIFWKELGKWTLEEFNVATASAWVALILSQV